MSKNKITFTEYYIVRNRTSGGAYLTLRVSSNNMNQPKYRWVKGERSQAMTLATYDAAQKARQRYGGDVVRCLQASTKEATTVIQKIVGD